MSARFRPEKAILELDGRFHTAVDPADFAQHVTRWRNQRWAEQVGLGALSEVEWIEHFGKFAPLEGSLPKPLALAYHGHQFQVYNPQIGDGRGFLFAQLRDGTIVRAAGIDGKTGATNISSDMVSSRYHTS